MCFLKKPMKIIHYLEITVLVTKNQNNIDKLTIAESIKEELEKFIKTKLKIENLKTSKITSEIETLDPELKEFKTIHKVKITINKKPEKIILDIYKKLENKDKDFLKETLITRLDDKCNFYLRIQLKDFIEKNKIKLTDSGDCIHIKAKVASYPANKENATQIIQNLLNKNERTKN